MIFWISTYALHYITWWYVTSVRLWCQFFYHGYNSWSLFWNFVQHGELLNDDYVTEGISLTRTIKTSSNLACVQPRPPLKKKKKKTEKVNRSFERGKKKIEINIIYFYLFVYLLQFNGLLNAQPFLPPGSTPPALAFFRLGWVGDPWAVKSPGVGTKKEGEFPVLRQHCNIFHWLHSRVVPWDFLFQLTSSFVIVLQSNLSLRTPL